MNFKIEIEYFTINFVFVCQQQKKNYCVQFFKDGDFKFYGKE